MIGEYSNKHLDLLAKLTPLDRIMCWCWNCQIKGLILPLKLVTYWNPTRKSYVKCRTCINLLPLLCLREGFLIIRQYYKYISNMATALNETDQMVTTPAPCSSPGVCKCYPVSLIPSSGFPVCDTNGVSQHSNLSVLTVDLWVSLNYNIFSIFPISQLIFFPPQDLCKQIFQSLRRRDSCTETGSPSTKFQGTELEQWWPAGEKSWIWAIF